MMTKKTEEILKECLLRYKENWDKNQYQRTQYDSDLEFYRGYRDHSEYPMAFNVSFNKILPIIYTILSRFMEQMFQTSDIVSVKPRKSADLQRAKSAEAILNYQLEMLNECDQQGGAYLTFYKWFFNTITFGKGIVKAYWKKEERITPRRQPLPVPAMDRFNNFQGWDIIDSINTENRVTYDGPYVEVLHNKLFIPDPEYQSIQQMPMCFVVYQRSMDYIKRMADKGIYKNIKDIGAKPYKNTSNSYSSAYEADSDEAFIKSLEIESAYYYDAEASPRRAPRVDILEAYGKMIIEEEPYEVGAGYKIKGKEEEVIVHIGNYSAVLSVQRNKYNTRPLFDMGCYYHPELFWDLGMVNLTAGIQEQVNNLANLRVQNAMMMINPMLKVNLSADIDPEALVWRPFGIVGVDANDDIEPLIIPDTNQNLFMEQEQFYKNSIQDIMGMYDYSMGATPSRKENVGTVYGIQQMGEARTKLLLMSMDYLGMRPLLRFLMTLNTWHLPSGTEFRIGDNPMQQQFGRVFGQDLHSDFDFAARYTSMEPSLGKSFRSQQLVQMAGMWQQNPWINQYQYNKTMMELLDIREADQLLKSPEQFQQEMQQQTQQQMQAQVAEVRGETESKIAKSQADSQGRMQVTDLKGKYDLALESMKLQAEERNGETKTASN